MYKDGKCRWTKTHFRSLAALKFDLPVQQFVLQEYVDAVIQAQQRVARLEEEMRRALPNWSLGPVVEALMALRGINVVTALVPLLELGYITRFDSPRQLIAHLGLVPSEHSSGSKRRQGSITKTGNRHVRRVLIEAAWCYQFPARKTKHLQQRSMKSSETVQAITWNAQQRLCGRYRHLSHASKLPVQVNTAIGQIYRSHCPRSDATAGSVADD